MARASVTAENAALNGLAGVGSTNQMTHVALHVGDPGTSGASENANAGSYARQACSWNAASAGAMVRPSPRAAAMAALTILLPVVIPST